MQNLIAEVLNFVTEDSFTIEEVEEIHDAIGWMVGMMPIWQPSFNSLTVLYNTVKEIRQQVEQAGGNCEPLLQQCAQRLCGELKQCGLFQVGFVYDIAQVRALHQYSLRQLIADMWEKNRQHKSTDEIIISQLLEIYRDKLAEATKTVDKTGIWYQAYWLPVLYCVLSPIDGGWKLNGINDKLCQGLKDSMSLYSIDGVKPIIYYTLEMLTWLPVKVDVAVDYSCSRDLTLYWAQWSDDDESCWDQELSGYVHGEEPFNEMWGSSLKINETNLLAELGLKK